MTEPESIMKPINEPDKVVCISADWHEAVIRLVEAAEYQLKWHSEDTVELLKNALAAVKSGGSRE